jgi:hypothetical protein
MAIPRFADRCEQPSVSSGTGVLTLGLAPSSRRPISSVYAENEHFPYCIEALDFAGALAGPWEVGRGHLNGSGQLVRDFVFASSSGTSLIDFNAVKLRVFIAPAAAALMVSPAELGFIEVPLGAAPLTPGVGFGRIYQKPDKQLYFVNSDGAEFLLTSSATPESLVIPDQDTTSLVDGAGCYVSANNTWQLARSNGTLEEATLEGAFVGNADTVVFKGRAVNMLFTTDGGSPTPGDSVFLAASTDDGGTGIGKLTATPPGPGFFLVNAGICLDNTNYASLKTSAVLFNPRSPVAL